MANEMKQHTLGSGEPYFARFLPGTQTPGAFLPFGNTPEFTITSESEELEHRDVNHGVAVKDDSVQTSVSMGGSLTTDNMNQENVALYFTGTTNIITESSASSQLMTIAAAELNGKYFFGVSPSKPTGLRNITVTSVTNSAASVTYVAGTDYLVDGITGTIQFIEGGAITKGQAGVKVNYSVGANSRPQIISGNDVVEGAMWFKSFNPKGPKRNWLAPYVSLKPDGEIALQGEDWQTLTVTVSVQQKTGYERLYLDGVAVAA